MKMTESKLKVMTIVGTRPEIIRLAAVVKLLDRHVNHKMIHTGQNYDYALNQAQARLLSGGGHLQPGACPGRDPDQSRGNLP